MSKSPIKKALTPEGFKDLKTTKPDVNSVGFAGIKATEIKYNGRGNEHVVILKAW